MLARINFYQRLVSTAIAYSVFGLGGLIIYLFSPLLYFFPITANKKQVIGRTIIYYCFRCFVCLMKILGIFTYEVHGLAKLKSPGQLIVANHPSLIDVVFLLSFANGTNCIVRYGLFKNFFTRGPLKLARYVVNKNPEQLIEDCVSTLNHQHSLLIFPEGTRTKPNQGLYFQKGTANIALRAKKNITPVVITCKPSMLQKGVKWYHIPKKRPHFIIAVKELYNIAPYLDGNRKVSVQSRHLNRDLKKYFETAIHAQTQVH